MLLLLVLLLRLLLLVMISLSRWCSLNRLLLLLLLHIGVAEDKIGVKDEVEVLAEDIVKVPFANGMLGGNALTKIVKVFRQATQRGRGGVVGCVRGHTG